MAKILSIDLGTTYFKVCLFNETGKLLALQRSAPPIEHPQPDRSELSVEAFRGTITQAIRGLARDAGGLDDVAALSFATQANSFTLLDEHDQPLTPLILWPDARACDFGRQLAQLAAIPGFAATTGMPMVMHELMAAKLLWLQEQQPQVYARAHRLCLLSDYLSYWLTGQHVSEAGMLALSALIDIHQLTWWQPACELIGLDATWLPRIVRAGTDLGPLRAEVAKALGLSATCRYVVGCLDQYAGAIGAGNVTAGGISETTGTVLATVRCADRFDLHPPAGVFQGPGFDPGVYFNMDFGATSANLLEAYRNSLDDDPSFAQLDAEAARIAPGAEGLRVKNNPDLNDPAAMFIGRRRSHGRGHEVRAILEAVAFALKQQVQRLYGKQRPSTIRAVGGAACSEVWLQIKADVLDCPFVATTCPEPTSLGAAMLAARALGWGDLPALAERWIETRPPHRPDAVAQRAYRSL